MALKTAARCDLMNVIDTGNIECYNDIHKETNINCNITDIDQRIGLLHPYFFHICIC